MRVQSCPCRRILRKNVMFSDFIASLKDFFLFLLLKRILLGCFSSFPWLTLHSDCLIFARNRPTFLKIKNRFSTLPVIKFWFFVIKLHHSSSYFNFSSVFHGTRSRGKPPYKICILTSILFLFLRLLQLLKNLIARIQSPSYRVTNFAIISLHQKYWPGYQDG